jgi:hypothetical protein
LPIARTRRSTATEHEHSCAIEREGTAALERTLIVA